MRIFVLVLMLAVAACGGGSPTSPTPAPPTPVPAVPVLRCPAAVTASTTSTAGTAVTFAAPTYTGAEAPVTVACTPTSGSVFPLGATQVACTLSDNQSRTAACGFAVNVVRIPVVERTNILAFGDSITLGEVTVPQPTTTATEFPAFKLRIVPEASYPTQLATQLVTRYLSQAQTIRVTNAGKANEQAADGAKRFPNLVANARPQVVLLLEGANDLSALGNAGFTQAILALDSMAKEARFRGARVFMATLTPPRAGGVNSLPDSMIVAFNARVKSTATGEGAVLVDIYTALSSNLSTYIGVDGLHPTEAGYRRIADTFFAAIQANLEVR